MSRKNLEIEKSNQSAEELRGHSTKQNILDAASKIMNKKGFIDSNIREIALGAGVKEPIIYQHFKGKDDILFSIVEQHMECFLIFLDEHLQGINGAYNKLRKLIWAHLRYNDINRDYITLVLLECRSNRKFYQSEAYKLIRRYAGILLRILEEGVKEQVFRADVNLNLFRDIILGVMDFEALTCLVTHEIQEATPDHEDIMTLLERMLLCKYKGDISPIGKRQRILRAAVQAFAKKGYTETTISQIASSAEVSEGTVYEYFKNKEDILLSIPEERFQDHLDRLKETFTILNSERKLRRFIQYHFRLYLIDREFLVVFLMLIQLNRRFYKSRPYYSLRKYIGALEELVQENIENGSFIQDCNVRIFRNMFLGAFTHMTLRWFVFRPEEYVDRMSEIGEVTDLFTEAMLVKER